MALQTPLTPPELAAEYRRQGWWKDITVYERVKNAAQSVLNKVAIVDHNRNLTYQHVLNLVDTIAGNLLALGIPKGGVVSVQLKNSAELPIMHLAAQRIGRVYMPLHDSWRDVEVLHSLRLSKAHTLLIPGSYNNFNYIQMIEEIRGELPDLKNIYVLEGNAGQFKSFNDLLKPHSYTQEQLDAERPDADAPAMLMLSGGTTSLSKISIWSSNGLQNMLNVYMEQAGYTSSDRTAAIAPAGTGGTGYIYGFLSPLLVGATSVILPKWKDPNVAVDLIVENKCTHAIGIPTQLTLMIPSIEQRNTSDFNSLKIFSNAGAPLTYETAEKIEILMDCKIQTIYGATDAGTPTLTSTNDNREKRLTTAGKVVRGCDCQLWDSNGKPVPQGESGEVVWRGPDKSWPYLGDPESTKNAFTADGYYRSGDLGRFDDEGYLRIVGRIKDMILRGGRNISPRTIEEPLMKHPAVLEAAVASMPDKILGERACAFVMLKDGCSLTFDDVVKFLTEEKLAVWQLPERLEILDDMPKSTGGKIAKAKLTAIVTEKLKAEGKI